MRDDDSTDIEDVESGPNLVFIPEGNCMFLNIPRLRYLLLKNGLNELLTPVHGN